MAVFEAGDEALQVEAIDLLHRLSVVAIMISQDAAVAIHTGTPMAMDAVRQLGSIREEYYAMIESFLKK